MFSNCKHYRPFDPTNVYILTNQIRPCFLSVYKHCVDPVSPVLWISPVYRPCFLSVNKHCVDPVSPVLWMISCIQTVLSISLQTLCRSRLTSFMISCIHTMLSISLQTLRRSALPVLWMISCIQTVLSISLQTLRRSRLTSFMDDLLYTDHAFYQFTNIA